MSGFFKGIPDNLSGIFCGIVIVFIWSNVFNWNLLGASLSVGLGVGMMCFQAHIEQLPFILEHSLVFIRSSH